MKKIVSVVAVSAGLAFGLAAPATAAEVPCGTPKVDAVYTTKVTPGKPAVWEERKVVDVAYQPAVPGTPAIPAVPEIPAQHYSLKGKAKTEKDGIPPTPSERPDLWQANAKKEPNGHHISATDDDGTAYVEGESGLHYTSAKSEGKRDWFYFQPFVAGKPAVPAVPGKPEVAEVSHIERVLVSPMVEEKRERVLVTPEVPAGPECPVVPEKPEPPVKPDVPVTEVVDKPQVVTQKRVNTFVDETPAPEELARTGSQNETLALLGAGMLGLGAILTGLRKRFN